MRTFQPDGACNRWHFGAALVAALVLGLFPPPVAFAGPPPPPRSAPPPPPPPGYPPPVVAVPVGGPPVVVVRPAPAPPPLPIALRVIYAPFYATGLILRYGLYYTIVAPLEVLGRTLSYGAEGGVERQPPVDP